MQRYRVAQVGAGARGVPHIKGFLASPDRFEMVGLCDIDGEKLARVAAEHGIEATYTDAEKMLADTRPDVFCFVTQPDVRLSMVELAAKYGVKAMPFEKPMATSLREAKTIADICRENGIKAMVCHQHKYVTSFVKLKELVAGGEIGEPQIIRATAQAHLSQLGTHYMDYALWINGGARAKWVVGHVQGKKMLGDSHPSPDYILGEMLCENGVRIYIECGHLAPSHMDKSMFWLDDRLTVYGTHGNAWADPQGRWGAFTRSSAGEPIGGEGEPWVVQERESLQPPYSRDIADWLDDDSKVHPCNVDIAYHGYEILEGLCLSSLDNTRMDLPLDPGAHEDVNERMRRELPDVAPLSEA